MHGASVSAITVLSDTEVSEASRKGLESAVERCEWIVSDPAGTEAAAFNRIVDDAAANWILVLREGEELSDQLSLDIAESIASSRAWGYRVSRRILYCGELLRTASRDPGEVRLFHRRRARRRPDGEMKVQGTVVRLASRIDVVLYASREEHECRLAERFEGRSLVRRLAAFVRSLFSVGLRAIDPVVRAYLWREAGWEKSTERRVKSEG